VTRGDIGRCAALVSCAPTKRRRTRRSFYLWQAEHPRAVLPPNPGRDGLRQIPEPAAIGADDALVAGPALGSPCIGADDEAVGKAQEERPPGGGHFRAGCNVAAIRQFG